MKKVWIVRWHGLEETCTSLPEALDRRDRLGTFLAKRAPVRTGT
jgi:hypothetical protein